ncbi:MAG: hypothetical protein KAU35_08435 [candidate division Zixibacteria bacterium]|nr:hypothetical protein [candidate division Zixibacteria bacterium]
MSKLCLILAAAVVLLFLGCADSDDATNPTLNEGEDPGKSITLDHVDGLVNGRIPLGQEATFHIRLANSTGNAIAGITNGLRVYSLDAEWTTTVGVSTGAITNQMLETQYINQFSITGSGADTVGFGAFKLQSDGIPDGFDAVCYEITIGPIETAAGSSICLDSSFYPPSGVWLWSGSDLPKFFPGWDGPHCYTIGE